MVPYPISQTSLQNDEREFQDNLTRVKKSIEHLQDQIRVENEKNAKHSQAQQDILTHRLEDAKTAHTTAEQTLRTIENDLKTAQASAGDTASRGKAIDVQIQQARKEAGVVRAQIGNLEKEQDNSLAPYGRDMKRVLDIIARTEWRGQRPVGPLGIYVKVKDQRWAGLMQTVIGSLMTAFAVTDPQDRQKLSQIMQQSGKSAIHF